MFALVFMLVCSGVAVSEAAPARYEIALSRPYRVGDRVFLEATGQRKHTRDLPGNKPPKVETAWVSLSGEVEVLEVRKDGQVKRSQIVLKGFEGRIDDAPVSGLAPGDTLLVSVEGDKTVYRREGVALEGPLQQLMRLIIQYKSDDGPDDQAYFGTETPQPIGGTWPVNARLASTALTRDKLVVEPEDVRGESRLNGVATVDDVVCLQVSGEMQVEDVEVELPRMAKLTFSAFSATMEGDFPTDTDLPPKRVKTSFDLDMRFKGTGLLAAFRFGAKETRSTEQHLNVIERGPRSAVVGD